MDVDLPPGEPNDIREMLDEADVQAYAHDPVQNQFTNEQLLATCRWVVRNQSRPTVVVSPYFFHGYYNADGNTLTAEDLTRLQQEELADQSTVENRSLAAQRRFVNRFAHMPDLLSQAPDAMPLLFRENFGPIQTLADTELIVVPVMLNHHYAMAVWDRYGDTAIQYYDSLGWPLQNGTIDGRRSPTTPNIRRDLMYIVRTIMDDATPIRLNVREHRLEEFHHNRQADLVFSDRQHNCGLHALLNLEAYLFNNGNCFIPGLNIREECKRVTRMLRALRQPTLPTTCEPPNFTGVATGTLLITLP